MPYELLIHLEQADSEQPFIQPENLTRFQLLNPHATPNNPGVDRLG